jgi:hypothetical protein
MRTAEQVLGIIRERGKRELPLENIYRQLYNPDLYLRAYAPLYSNDGAMTPGTTTETADEMSMTKIYQLIDDLRHERCRWINGRMSLRVPKSVIEKKCALYMQDGKPIHRAELLEDDDFTIIDRYQSEYRGVIQYYLLATNVSWFTKLRWIMQTSLLKTLAHKHKASVRTMKRKFQSTTTTAYGTMKCLEVKVEREEGKKPLVARFGGIPLRRQRTAVLVDQTPLYVKVERNELFVATDVKATAIGAICEGTAITLFRQGKPSPLRSTGWDHLRST